MVLIIYSLYFSDLSDIRKSTTFLCSFCAAETPLAASPVVSHFAALAKEDLIGRRDTCDLLRDVGYVVLLQLLWIEIWRFLFSKMGVPLYKSSILEWDFP